MTSTPHLWLLKDNRAGNYSQQLGIAAALGYRLEEKQLSFSLLARLPLWLQGASTLSLTHTSAQALPPTDGTHWPDVILSAGRRHVPIARWLKKQAAKHGKHARIAHLMWPGCDVKDIDLIITPQHDGIKQRSHGQLCTTLGAPHRLTQEKLSTEKPTWQATLGALPNPHITLLIGGKTKHQNVSGQDVAACVALAEHLAGNAGSVLLSTSRRSCNAAIAASNQVMDDLPPARRFMYHPKDAAPNPYLGMLAQADMLIVTGDSISMASEAASLGKTLIILSHENIAPEKHRNFHAALAAANHALIWNGKNMPALLQRLAAFQPVALPNAAQQAAAAIRQMVLATGTQAR